MKEVDLEEFDRCLEYFRKINSTPFKELKWTLHGKEIKPEAKSQSQKDLFENWEKIGLNNSDYGKFLIGEF